MNVVLSSCSQPSPLMHDKLMVPDSNALSVQTAKLYVKNYQARAGSVDSLYTQNSILKTKKVPDSRSIWFSLARLQAAIKQIQNEGGDGVRFYFASYDKRYVPGRKGIHVPPRDYWGHNTLIMVSTRDSLSFHRDYYTDKNVTNENRKGIILNLGDNPENRGEMCPPPSNCIAIGATLVSN